MNENKVNPMSEIDTGAGKTDTGAEKTGAEKKGAGKLTGEQLEARIRELGFELPTAPAKGGIYTPCKEFCQGKLAYVSGCGPAVSGQNITGKAGAEVDFDEASQAAVNCLLNVLAVLKAQLGDLSRIKSFVKMLVFVASSNDFYDQPKVANAATGLLAEIFGEEIGCPSRSAIGVNVLPGNITVEIEMLVELEM